MAGDVGIGGIISGVWGGSGYHPIQKTRDPALASALSNAYTDWYSGRNRSLGALNAFSRDWATAHHNAQANLPQEQAAIGGYYDGTVERALAGMRAQASAAERAAGDQSKSEFWAGLKGQSLGGPVSSSYYARAAMPALARINTSAAINDAARTRSDFDAIERARMNLLGRRSDLENQVAMGDLVPSQMRQQYLTGSLANLGALGGLGEQAYYRGLEKNRNAADAAGAASGAIWNMAGSVYGGGAGNFGRQNQAPPPGGYGGGYNPNYASNPGYGSWTQGYQGQPYMSVPTGTPGGGMSVPMYPYPTAASQPPVYSFPSDGSIPSWYYGA